MSEMYFDKEEDAVLYLMKIFNDGVYIGCVKTPTEETTLKEFKKWQYRNLVNMIVLNKSYIPQIFEYGNVNEFWKIPTDDFVDEYQDFRKLLLLLLNANLIDFYDFKNLIIEKCVKKDKLCSC
jgi:hypothetical protein